MTQSHTYAQSGVNIELGDEASKILYNASRTTWENRKSCFGQVLEFFSDFSGLRAINVSGLPQGSLMSLGFDGVGTKIYVAERTQKHDTVPFDLLAMVCDDAVVRGAEPVLVGSVLDVRSAGEKGKEYLHFVRQLANGLIAAAKEANVAVINGEFAELGARVQGYGDFNYNWGAGVAWFAKKDRLFTGNEVKCGDSIVALREDGFRSNGLSLTRRILESHHGQNWHELGLAGQNLGELVLTPSRIYCAAICEMTGGFEGEPQAEIHAVAHITGGGVPGKLGRILKPSQKTSNPLGAALTDLFEPSPVMQYVQEIGNVADAEAYKTWNMRQGMLVMTPEPQKVIEIARSRNIEAKEVGVVEPGNEILIRSKGVNSSGKDLTFKVLD